MRIWDLSPAAQKLDKRFLISHTVSWEVLICSFLNERGAERKN